MLHKALICHIFAEISPLIQTFKSRPPLRFLFSGGNFSWGHAVLLAGNFGKSVPSGGADGQSVPCIVSVFIPSRHNAGVVSLDNVLLHCVVAQDNVEHSGCMVQCEAHKMCVLWVQPHPVLTNSDMHTCIMKISKRPNRRF